VRKTDASVQRHYPMPRTVRQDGDPSNEIVVAGSPAATFSAREDVMSRME
jgi:hypothetical protein